MTNNNKLENCIYFFSIIFKKPGKTINNNGNATMKPPITAIASGWCICAPVPMPSARGESATMEPKAVIKLGRKRAETANLSELFPPVFSSDKYC